MLRPSAFLPLREEWQSSASGHLFAVQYLCVWGLCMCINMMDSNLHLLTGTILFLTSMDVSVFLHIRLLVEALATVLAGIGPCVWMDQQMSGEGGGTFECLPTHLALKASFLLQKENHRNVCGCKTCDRAWRVLQVLRVVDLLSKSPWLMDWYARCSTKRMWEGYLWKWIMSCNPNSFAL